MKYSEAFNKHFELPLEDLEYESQTFNEKRIKDVYAAISYVPHSELGANGEVDMTSVQSEMDWLEGDIIDYTQYALDLENKLDAAVEIIDNLIDILHDHLPEETLEEIEALAVLGTLKGTQ